MLAEEADREPLRELLSPRWIRLLQPRPGLGNGLAEVFRAGRRMAAPFAMALSADNPSLPRELIADATAALREGKAVLGPCPDGGYYLVGLPLARLSGRRLEGLLAAVFLGPPLGAADVATATASALESQGLKVTQLQPWADVDTEDDLAQLGESLASEPALAPATAEWFSRNGAHTEHQPSGSTDAHVGGR
jgi:glycosyltransferase A (GT-A) superfamily protein (DUF2064 family)